MKWSERIPAPDDGLVEALAAHRLYGEEGDDYECGCGETAPAVAYEDDFGELVWHEAHVADAIRAAGWSP